MAYRSLLIDTSIIIEFLRKKNKRSSVLWDVMEDGLNCVISTITIFELYAGAKTKKHITDLEKILKWLFVVPFSREIAEQSAEIYKELRRNNQLIDFRDIFIGATSIVLDIPIVTHNKRHFERIQGITIYGGRREQ